MSTDIPSPLITLRDHWEAIGRPDPLDALWLLGRYNVRVGVYTGRYTDATSAYSACIEGRAGCGPMLAEMVEALNTLAATDHTPEKALEAMLGGGAVATTEPPIDPVGAPDAAWTELGFCDMLLNGLARRDLHMHN